MKAKFIWFSQDGKMRASTYAEIEQVAYRRFCMTGYSQALHIAILAKNPTLPGLKDKFTDLAMTIIPEDGPAHHFAAGTFSR